MEGGSVDGVEEEYFDRELLDKLKKWIDRKEIIAVKGPRQSGKTTLLKMAMEWIINDKGIDEEYVVFKTMEDPEFKDEFEGEPRETVESYLIDDEKHYFFLDEFNYVEEGGKKLKYLYDVLENVKFIVTGSSSLELTGKTSKYLVGRMFSSHLYPFSFWEFLNVRDKRLARLYSKKNKELWGFLREGSSLDVGGDVFVSEFSAPFEEYLRYGAYPEVIKTDDEEMKKTVLKNLFDTYIARDIIALLQIQESSKMREIVKLLSSQLGGIVNYNNLSDSCGLYFKKIKDFLRILEETYVIDMVKPYHKNLKTELRKNPKTYFVDLGLRNYSLGNFLPLESRTDVGEMVENFVLTQFRHQEAEEIHYWRTQGKAEVDFIYKNGQDIVPVEVKYKSFDKPKISRGYRSYISTYEPERALVATKDFWGEEIIGGTEVRFVPVCYF
ncbi:MAG: ATP-binding protein [Thermoplasmatota archaeon]